MLSPWLLSILECPKDHGPLDLDGQTLRCPAGHEYALVDGIPILLRDDVEHPHWIADHALAAARGDIPEESPAVPGPIDPFVQEAIGATGGFMYEGLKGRLTDYPIPDLPLPAGAGATLLDIGCNWGRWTFAATRRGYRAVGVDPSFVGVRAARRVCRQLGLDAEFIVGDARHLPFKPAVFQNAFSYSVLQHFSKENAKLAFMEAGRVLAPGGVAMIQMGNTLGVRSLYHQARRGFRPGKIFEVRYWTGGELRAAVSERIGPAEIEVDGFFSLNSQPAEAHLLPLRFRLVVQASELLKHASSSLPLLKTFADSLYVRAVRRETGR